MTEANAKVEALEQRMAELERELMASARHLAELSGYVSRMDDEYQKMMRAALHKYDITLRFVELAGPLILECHKALFPTRAEETNASLRIFTTKGGPDKIN